MKSNLSLKIVFVLLFATISGFAQNLAEQKPFARWWWMGSAVNQKGIKYNLEAFHKAGLGGVEITPIYGVKGQEDNFIPFLSDHWLKMLDYTTHVADSLGMKVDMVLGTGWPYGGPQVEVEYAATKMEVDSFQVAGGERIEKNLKHNKPDFRLLHLLSYDVYGKYEDLTSIIKDDVIRYVNDGDSKKVYAIYAGKTGQKVKRSAPGGEGYTVDHYSKEAFDDYVQPFNEKLNSPIRAIFNDSYEVYNTDFSPALFEEFRQRRGYDLKPYLNLLIQKENTPNAARIRSDYRETLSDMLKDNFNRPWTSWAHNKGYKTKLQAHGSPGNLLDLYATADIPECETFGSMPFDIPGLRREAEDIREGDANPMMLKFSSSAAHMSGKKLVSSESFTWLRDHFKTALSQTKPELEELFLNGVNHIFLHGSTYSPPNAEWPGWKFYASVNFSPQLPIWNDANALFSYVANCQSYLQKGQPDNEIALYWPVYDNWAEYVKGTLFLNLHIHSLQDWLLETPFYKLGNNLREKGYSLDFFSDEFLQKATVENGKVKFEGAEYAAIVIPATQHMPLETLKKLLKLKSGGANVIFEKAPNSVPGFYEYESKERELKELSKGIEPMGSEEIHMALNEKGVRNEELSSLGLKFIRRKDNGDSFYYIVNHTAEDFDAFVTFSAEDEEFSLYDPLTGEKGNAEMKEENTLRRVRLQLKAGNAIFVIGSNKAVDKNWEYISEFAVATEISGPFELTFIEGGPTIPTKRVLKQLRYWNELGAKEKAFSGRAAYETRFNKPKTKAAAWLLQLPELRESARVFLNGENIGTVWANPLEIKIDKLKKKGNLLRLEVSNLAANRIKAKEEAGEEWKIFYEINMVNKDYKPFDAKLWDVMPSGLSGTLKLVPLIYD
ncbi:hypothetical protein SAMN06298216_3572 [Spirosomataceae bacterium TFI 002]|nr:hypothetical protein SAMN06298216_3572 [Spirosomataceae bacterium TFI 002]